MWGCMTSQGPGMMFKIEGQINQHLYKEILDRDLLATLFAYDLNSTSVIFQQDNDPKHTASKQCVVG